MDVMSREALARAILRWPGAIDEAGCARLRGAMDRGSASPAEIWDGDYRLDLDVRRTWDSDVDAGAIAIVDALFDQLTVDVERFFRFRVTRREGPGFLRYERGGFYRCHRDIPDGAMGADHRRVSIVLFLSTAAQRPATGHCVGGALRLHDSTDAFLDVEPLAGQVVAFPATVLHEVRPVVAGTRDVVVDWFY
jgi:predicted 2-oxoglutarate/Fe(II)-dependent dioxygenase YbiX